MEAKYNKIGNNYNLTRKADPYLTERLYKNLNPKPNGLYLDIGCGTGNYTDALQKKRLDFIGIDPSLKMLEEAKKKNSKIDFRIGQAENTGLENNSIDGIIGSLTIHHWNDLEKGFKELYRVLKPKGSLVIFTSTPQQMKGYWLNHYFPKMLEDSILQMPSFKNVESAISNSGFTNMTTEIYNIQPDLEDLFLYCGKHNPNLYFNEQIRSGISSFSALSNADEVEQGLQTLKDDITTGNITKIIDAYKNDFGDYLYFIAKK